MYQWLVILVLLGIVYDLSQESLVRQQRMQQDATVVSTGDSINAYGSAVSNWSHSNPAFNGTISDVSLNLPSWIYHGNVSNCIQSGSSYIYFTPPAGFPSSRLASYLASNGNRAGINSNGNLYNGGSPVLTVPACVPNNSVVLVL